MSDRGWGKLIAAKVVCCGVLLLFLSGMLTLNGVLGWLANGNTGWLVVAGVGAAAGGFALFRRRDSGAGEKSQPLETKSVR